MGLSPGIPRRPSCAARSARFSDRATRTARRVAFSFAPAARLAESPFPILRIWQLNQNVDHDHSPVRLDDGGIKLLVFRCEDLDIEFQPLSDGAFHLLSALTDGCDFATACEQAMTVQPDFDLPASFRRHVLQGVLVAFDLPDSSLSIHDHP